MIDFLSAHAGMIGLLFFFIFFVVLVLWTFRAGSKENYNESANIPFEENE